MTADGVVETVLKALSDPFLEVWEGSAELQHIVIPTTPKATTHQTEANSRLDDLLSDFSTDIFNRPIELVLRPHATVSQIILTRIYEARSEPTLMNIVERYGSDLVEKLEEIRRYYRLLVETCADTLLDQEAERLVKRFFGDQADENKNNFIKLKRFYEKIRSFQDIAEERWSDIQKLVDTFAIIPETRHLVKDLPDRHIPDINSLLRRTGLFLLRLKDYAHIEDSHTTNLNNDSNLTVKMTYDPQIRYTIKDALNTEQNTLEELFKDNAPNSKIDTHTENIESTEFEDQSSIAHNIVLESRSRRFHRSNFFSVPLKGSRDWNRTKHYSLEIGMIDYQKEHHFFYESFHLILNRDDLEKAVQLNNLVAARDENQTEGQKRGPEYTSLMIETLDSIASDITTEDFPGAPTKEIFLYHIGPVAFRSMQISILKSKQIGDIFYINASNQIVRILPELVITKLLIDWWVERFENLDIEEVDSYLNYSRTIEFLRSEFLVSYEKAREIRRSEDPTASYRNFDDWLRKNRNRIFGRRKYLIFQRFFPDLLFQMNEESIH